MSGGSMMRWAPAGLAGGAAVALLGALVVRGETSLAFLGLFVVLLPAALAAMLLRWSPWPAALLEDERDWRRILVLCGAGLLLAAVITLLLGVAWSGGRLGNVLLVAGILLLPPATIVAALGWLLGHEGDLLDELAPGERVEARAREHWAVFLPPAGVLLLAALLALGPFGVIGYSAAGVIYLLLLPGLAVPALGAWLNTALVLTPEHLWVARGVLRRRVERIARGEIMAAGVNAGWLGALLDYGRLSVICHSGRTLAVVGVAGAAALRERLGVLELREG